MVRLIALASGITIIPFTCFNSRDGAIDREDIASALSKLCRVSIPEMVRLIEPLPNSGSFDQSCFNSRDGAIDSCYIPCG